MTTNASVIMCSRTGGLFGGGEEESKLEVPKELRVWDLLLTSLPSFPAHYGLVF